MRQRVTEKERERGRERSEREESKVEDTEYFPRSRVVNIMMSEELRKEVEENIAEGAKTFPNADSGIILLRKCVIFQKVIRLRHQLLKAERTSISTLHYPLRFEYILRNTFLNQYTK